MMELLLLFALFFAGLIALKIIFLVFKISFWALSLPLQILAGVFVLLLGLVFFVPLGLVLGLLAVPFALIFAFLPFILIGWGLYLLLRS